MIKLVSCNKVILVAALVGGILCAGVSDAVAETCQYKVTKGTKYPIILNVTDSLMCPRVLPNAYSYIQWSAPYAAALVGDRFCIVNNFEAGGGEMLSGLCPGETSSTHPPKRVIQAAEQNGVQVVGPLP